MFNTMSFENKFNKNEGSNDQIFQNKKHDFVSEEWLYVDKRYNNEICCSCSAVCVNHNNVSYEKCYTSSVLSKLQPFIPLSVEEASFTNSLKNWTNCNVRLLGILKYHGNECNYYLESVNEPGGPYKIALSFKNAERIPLLNELIQVFGEIKVDVCLKPFVMVSFFRNMESGNFLQYMEAIEKMKSFIPLFIKTTDYSSVVDYDKGDFVHSPHDGME